MTSTHPTLADLQALTAEEPFVRALARGLLGGDAAAADDVIQQTWLEVLRRGAPDALARRGWLARVVRTRVRNLRRGEARRSAREREAARPEAVLAPDEFLARAEQRRQVVAAVATLREPYRTAILLRYLEGLTPRAIAARLGVPRETVATRLKRGLALLRERFDQTHGGNREVWIAALAPLAVPARGAVGGSALVANLFGLVAGLSAMKYIMILAGAAMALALFFSRSAGDSPEPVDPRAGDAVAARPDHARDRRDADAPTRVAIADAGASTAAAGPAVPIDAAPELPSTAALVGRAVTPDGAPAATRACRLYSFDPLTGFGSVQDPRLPSAMAGPTWIDTVTDASGRFEFERVPPGGLHALWLAHDGPHATWLPLPSTPGAGERVDLGTVVLETHGAITGAVVGPDGEPVVGADVWALDLPGALFGLAPFDRVEADGALLVALPVPQPDARGAVAALEVAEAVRDHLQAWVLQAPADAAFQVLPFPAWLSRLVDALPRPHTRTGADGRFALAGVAAGDNLLVVRGAGLAPGGRPRVPVRAGAVRDVGVVRLAAGDTTCVRVLDADGAPVAGAEVRIAARPQLGLTGILFAGAPRRADAEGTVEFAGLPRGNYVVAYRRAAGDGFATFGPVGAGEDVAVRLPAERVVQLEVSAGAGVELEAVEIQVRAGPPFGEATAAGMQPVLDPARHVAALDATADGARRFALRGLHAGVHTIAVRAPGAVPAITVAVPGLTGPEDVLRVALEPGVDRTVEVVDEQGRAVAGAEVLLASDFEPSPLAVSMLVAYGGVSGFRWLPRTGGTTDPAGRVVVEGAARSRWSRGTRRAASRSCAATTPAATPPRRCASCSPRPARSGAGSRRTAVPRHMALGSSSHGWSTTTACCPTSSGGRGPRPTGRSASWGSRQAAGQSTSPPSRAHRRPRSAR